MSVRAAFGKTRPLMARYDVSPHLVKLWKTHKHTDGQVRKPSSGLGCGEKAADPTGGAAPWHGVHPLVGLGSAERLREALCAREIAVF